jgi:hypothetical protein
MYASWSIPNGPGDFDGSRGYVLNVYSAANYLHAAFDVPSSWKHESPAALARSFQREVAVENLT